jgi:hypothetical protein
LQQESVPVFCGEVEAGEFAVIFSCGFVVSAGGFELGEETAEVNSAAIDVYVGIPEFAAIMEFSVYDAFEPGGAAGFASPAILHILEECGKLKISPSVVEAEMIGVVNEFTLRWFHNFIMHPDQLIFLPV